MSAMEPANDTITATPGVTLYVDLNRLTLGALVCIGFGVPGNLLTIAIARKKNNRKLSNSVYMGVMAVADTILLLEIGWYCVFLKLVENEVPLSATWFFRTFSYITYTSAMLSGLFLAAMSLDRMLAVKFPMVALTACTTRRAKVTVITMTVIIVTLNLHLMYATNYVRDKELGIIVGTFEIPNYPELVIVSTAFQVAVGTVLPFLIIFTANIVIIVTLGRAKTDKALGTTSSKTREEKLQKDTRYLTRMLIFVSLAYIVTSLPYRLFHFAVKIPGIAERYDFTNVHHRYRYTNELWTVVTFWTLNFSLNFYLYCIGGGRRYRNDAKEVLSFLFCCKK